jgi:tetratricopeptide (TPR) repeat protein
MKKGLYAVGQLLFFIIVFTTTLHGQVIKITKQYVYAGSEIDTIETCRIIGFEKAKRLILDELEANLINDNRLKKLHLSKNMLITYIAGIVIPEISDEKQDNRQYSFKIRVETSHDEVVNFTKLNFKDMEKTEELEETKKNTEGALKRIIKLQQEISPDYKRTRYFAAVEQLKLEQYIEKGYILKNRSMYEAAIEAFGKAIAFKPKHNVTKQETNSGTVTVPAAHLRSRPSRESSPAGYVTKGTRFLILGESKDNSGGLWYKIKLPVSKKQAWIASGSVNPAKYTTNTTNESNYSVTRAYTGRGSVYLKLGKPSEAIGDYDKTIQLNPHSVVAYNYRGMSYIELGNYKKAVEDFNMAIELEPKRIAGYINRGFAYTELEDFQKAKKDFDYAIYMEPRNKFAYLNRGRLYAKSGDFKEAIKDYDRVILLNPSISIAYAGRGANYAALKDYENASKDLITAIELNPKNSDAMYSLGTVYLNMGETEKAVENYKAAAMLGDKDAQGYLKKKGIPWDDKK